MEYESIILKDEITVRKIYTIHYFEYMKNFEFSGETHDFWELQCVDKGEIKVLDHILKAGQVIFHKPNGYETIDIRQGGLHARLVSAQKRILAYLDGEITEIPELLEERLPYKPSAPEGLQKPFNMNNWCNIVTAGNMGTGTI